MLGFTPNARHACLASSSLAASGFTGSSWAAEANPGMRKLLVELLAGMSSWSVGVWHTGTHAFGVGAVLVEGKSILDGVDQLVLGGDLVVQASDGVVLRASLLLHLGHRHLQVGELAPD